MRLLSLVAVLACVSCSNRSAGAAPPTHLEIVTASGAPLAAYAGDGLALKVVAVGADGAAHDLPDAATVRWTAPATVTALAPNTNATSPIPAFGDQPTGVWFVNPGRPDTNASLAGVLFVLDAGKVQNASIRVAATVSGAAPGGSVEAAVAVSPIPAGDFAHGAAVFGANCASCHGATGHGSPGASGASSYVIMGATYAFPAPGIHGEPGNLASDPAWSAAALAAAARADVDNRGVTLRYPMVDWLVTFDADGNAPLTAQDFADVYAFLKTQTR